MKKQFSATLLVLLAVACASGQSNVNLATTTAATAGPPPTNANSPTLNLIGNYWNGSVSASDTWSIQNILQSGTTNPSSTLYISHFGSSGAAIVQAPGFQSLGSGAGGIAWPMGATPSIPGVGLTANAISHYAPASVTAYGIAWPGTAATGLFSGILGSGATFSTPTITSGSVQAITVTNGGSGYLTPPSCYFTGGSPTTIATCHFTVSAGAIASVVLDNSGGAGYGSAPSISAATTMSMSYLTVNSPLTATSTTLACAACLTGTTPTSGNVMIGQGSQALAPYPGITASGSPSGAVLAVAATTPDVQINQQTAGDNMLTLKQAGSGSTNPAFDIQNASSNHLFTVNQGGIVSNYNGFATAGAGMAWVVGTKNVTGTAGNATTGAQTLFSAGGGIGASATYRVDYYIDQNGNCNNAGTVNITFSWTDQNHARTATPGSAMPLSTTNGAGNNASGQIFINVAASTSVTWNTSITGTCSTGGTYDVYTTIERTQ